MREDTIKLEELEYYQKLIRNFKGKKPNFDPTHLLKMAQPMINKCYKTIEVIFNALRENKFLEQIKLEVEDVEGNGIKQEEKTISIDAEAFNISLNDSMVTFLDFGAVRVGEPKELPLYLKNQGQYPISYDFRMKRALTKQMFTITPM